MVFRYLPETSQHGYRRTILPEEVTSIQTQAEAI